MSIDKLILLFLIFYYTTSQAQNSSGLHPFSDIGKNSIKSFTGLNPFLHCTGILSTYLLIKTGTDYRVHNYFTENGYSSFFDPAVGIGYIMPAVLGGGLYLYGISNENTRIKAAGSAVIQAVIVSAVYSSLLKAFTGRPNPDPWSYADGSSSGVFRLGFMRGGIHFGWPSGHLCTNTAVAASLISFYPKSTGLKIAGLLYIGYLFYGVTAHDGNTMHWFSDVVSGLLMGCAIGSTIGDNFRKEWEKTQIAGNAAPQKEETIPPMILPQNNSPFSIIPLVTDNYKGLQFNFNF